MEQWQSDIEAILRQVPGFDPWALAGDSWLDHAAAARAINWFPEHLKHVEGSARGQPFILRKWQAAIVGNLFGWKRKDEAGRIVRRFRKCFIKVARGNGKSPLASGIALFCFFEDQEPGAQCFLAAGQREQAGILFRNARGMVEQDPGLLSRVKIYGGDQHRSLILTDDPLSFCRVIPADAAGQHGGIPHVVVVDELHVQESRDLLDVFETAMSKKVRSQPLLVEVTTADYDRPSICNEVDDYAHAVRDNGGDPNKPGHDPAFLPVIYELTDADDYTDEAVWIKANPNLDVSVSRESLRAIVRKAKETPALENAVKRLHFNIRTTTDVKLIPMDAWDECKGEVTDEELAGCPNTGGLDLASTEDLASFARAWRLPDGRVAVKVKVYCPEERVKVRARRKVPYDVWAAHGYLTATSGYEIDYDTIKADVLAAQADGMNELGYDSWGAPGTMQDLEKAGVVCVKVPQSFLHLSAATKLFLQLIRTRRLIHDGNPVVRWAATNAVAKYDGKLPSGENIEEHLDRIPIMISKRNSANKVDPIAATVIAIYRLMAQPEGTGSVYDSDERKDGLLVL